MLKSILFVALLAAAPAVALELHEVPAISSIKRMPDRLPSDILGQNELHFIAAKGEFEPASFIMVPKADMDNVELQASDLKGEAGVIPATALDIKVVKTWYQDGTAWFSYFADPARRELVPELLLHDENLVRVDRENQKNYLRVGDEYQWVNFPEDQAEKFFNYFTEPVADAPTLQPISLKAGENKQIWVTLKVPSDAKPGNYTGTITLSRQGKKLGEVQVKAHVLPFELPAPKTYYNLDNPFFVSIYRTGVLEMAKTLGIPDEEAIEFQRRIYKNLKDHNVFNPRAEVNLRGYYEKRKYNPEQGAKLLKTELELLKEAGLTTQPLLSSESRWFSWKPESEVEPEEFQKSVAGFQERMKLFRGTVQDVLGHNDVYATSWDEAGVKRIKQMRDEAQFADFPGLKWWITTAKDKHFNLAGYLFDYANQAGLPTREQAATWHSIGSKIASYASPHTGVENPDVYRRWEGLARYKANYDGSFNYKLYDALHPTIYEKQKRHLWNDAGGATFRTFNMIFPTKDGIVDTISWEGFREGIDDIRYATLLKQKARQAEASGNMQARHLARKALMWLELTDMEKTDLNTARQEMINYILKLDALLK